MPAVAEQLNESDWLANTWPVRFAQMTRISLAYLEFGFYRKIITIRLLSEDQYGKRTIQEYPKQGGRLG